VLITAVPDAHVNGTYASELVVPADRLIRRPADVDPVAAAALWVAHSTAYGALFEKATLRPGDHLLITAATSSVGLAAIQIANQIGAVPIAVTRSAAKRGALEAAGAASVIALDKDDLHARVAELTGSAGVEVILDAVMGPGLADLGRAARFAGTIVTVGWLDPRPPVFPSVPITVHRYMSFEHVLNQAIVARMAAFLFAGIRSGVIKPIVDRTFPLAEVARAHERLESSQGVGKVVLTV
jgi:NADPH:quinone reductase-like Zn-dependent oxidoreductase